VDAHVISSRAEPMGYVGYGFRPLHRRRFISRAVWRPACGAEPGGRSGVPGMAMRSEVKVLSWSPDRGNPTPMTQGRGPESTGRPAGTYRRWASVRAGLKEAVGAPWTRTKVKRRKAFLGWVSRPPAAMPSPCRSRGRIGDAITAKSHRLTPGDLPGPDAVGRPEDQRTRADGPAEVGGSRRSGRRGNAR